ncbi:NADH-quinone oxidoreductase subunit C [Nocardioides sp. Y6]|uniref:NADH-quinone oxidoreductase subunit C n=1 Tax=Nocardioides malaquae TaxID=2773426 RepID=A0ABR9RW28_9ACTN|nr:NADH-quinone oxidoreductase subunit C [Nocardioides malaquae]MBE7325565.1 NADH-quinone oxidoreductase subunit C [Nocardioides malaquae]
MTDTPKQSTPSEPGKGRPDSEDATPDSARQQTSPAREDAVVSTPEVHPDGDTVSSEVVGDGTQVDAAVGVRRGMFGVTGTGDVSGFGGLVAPTVFPGASSQPYGGWFDETADALTERLTSDGVADAVSHVVVDRGEITFHVRREHLLAVVQVLRDDEKLRFEFLASISGVHYPDDTGRELHVVLHLLSMSYNRRIRVEVTAPDSDPHVPSVVAVYPTADWQEREVWDMFGVIFDGHPALTRILMPDDWPGHPQRKDYPLGGIPVEYKGATTPPPDQRRSYN